MIEAACRSSLRIRSRARQLYVNTKAPDLSIHDTWIIWRLVFLPDLIYRGVIIRRSQRRRRHRSCITILRRALRPHRLASRADHAGLLAIGVSVAQTRTSVISHLSNFRRRHCDSRRIPADPAEWRSRFYTPRNSWKT